MKLPEDPNERKAAIIAACITFGAALIILVMLFIFTIGGTKSELAEASMPEIQDNEEISLENEFLEPEFLEPEPLDNEEGVDEESDLLEESSPQPEGEPEFNEEPQDIKTDVNEIVPEEQPKNEQPEAKPAPKPAPETPPTKNPTMPSGGAPKETGEKESAITTQMQSGFNKNNGSPTGNSSVAITGSGGNGNDKVEGALDGGGREMLNITMETVPVRSPVTIKVQIVVNAAGSVVGTPVILSGGGDKTQKEACKRMAKSSKWKAKKGAENVNGTITFYLKPD